MELVANYFSLLARTMLMVKEAILTSIGSLHFDTLSFFGKHVKPLVVVVMFNIH